MNHEDMRHEGVQHGDRQPEEGKSAGHQRNVDPARIDPARIDPARIDPARIDPARIDPAAVAALYVEHAEELKRFLFGVLRDWSLAQDAMQAAFTKLVEVGHQTRNESRKAWVFRVAYHEALQILRRKAVGERAVEKVAWSQRPADGDEDPLVRAEQVDALKGAFQQLTPDQRQMVQMRIYEEKTFAVIARELDIPLGTALSRMRAAMIVLKRMLSENAE